MTKGEAPSNPDDKPIITSNLGPTGLRGWAYHRSQDTSESRQILVTAVDSGSPADGRVEDGDVILGANGKGSNPSNFVTDARKSLALAIADAEARQNPTLRLRIWRAGKISNVDLTLQTLGSYSDTAPYDCPKSKMIFEKGMQFVFENESAGRFNFGGLSMLLDGKPAHLAKARTIARAAIPTDSRIAQLKSDALDLESKPTWHRGHNLIFLAEYYLATRDAEVLPAIEAYAINIAKNRSMFGTVGHIYADRNPDGSLNGPMGGHYGAVNSAGLPCFLGVVLAKECGISDPNVDSCIAAANRFFAFYSGKGAIPYGEHGPRTGGHESNGKCGNTALLFHLQDGYTEEAKFFAKMAVAGATEREVGHNGAWFNYVWAPIGAATGGREAAAAHFKEISWMLDLNRRWDWGFKYDCLYGEGPNNGRSFNDFRMSTPALLTYGLPYQKTYLTGKKQDQRKELTSQEVSEAVAASRYAASSRSTSQLIEDLGNWSPIVQTRAVVQLKKNNVTSTQLATISRLATDPNSKSRAAACQALGALGSTSSSDVLINLLDDDDAFVRYRAAEAARQLPRSANLKHLDKILRAAVTTLRPALPISEDDPLQLAHSQFGMLLFYSGRAFGNKGILWDSVDGIDRNLLYPAITAVSKSTVGLSRSTLELTYSNLTRDDVFALSGTILDSLTSRAPADRMFSIGVRQGASDVLQKFGIADGVAATVAFMEDEVGGRKRQGMRRLVNFGGNALTVKPDARVAEIFQSYFSNWEYGEEAKESLEKIQNDSNPIRLTPLKSITSASADDTLIAEGSRQTTLRVSGRDFAKGDSVYTWKLLSGPPGGTVQFQRNRSAAAANTIVTFSNTPGDYTFEVTMSDSRGLSEVSKTVEVRLHSEGAPPISPESYLPGLRFGRLNGNMTSNAQNPGGLLDRVLSVSDEADNGIPIETTEVFTGEIYDADGVISFTEDIDDKARIWINGQLVLDDDAWKIRTETGRLSVAPGWQQIEIRISNASGGSGTREAPGIAFDPQGGSNWQNLEDPGDGSLLRTRAQTSSLPVYTIWSSGGFKKPFLQKDLEGNQDGDSMSNLMEFAFGMDPTDPTEKEMRADGSEHGAPMLSPMGEQAKFEFSFVRRDDHGQPGSLTYLVQFSSDLGRFYDSTVTPVFVADSRKDSAYEIAKVPFPEILPNGEKAIFARVKVIASP